MNFKDCILGKVNEGKLDKKKGQELLNKFDQTVERYKAQGRSADAAMAAADDMLKIESARIEQRQRNLRNSALWQKNAGDKFAKHPGKARQVADDYLQKAAYRAQTVQKEAYSIINQVAEKIEVNALGLSRNYDLIQKGVRSLLGEAVDDAEAVKIGEVFKQTFDMLHTRYRQAGGVVGKLERYFPQIHSKDAILKSKIDKAGWIEYVMPLLERERMVDFDTGAPLETAKLREMLGDTYDSIVTAGRSDLEKIAAKGDMPAKVSSDIDMRHSDRRFLHFKDASAFMEYNRRFGVGDEGLPGVFLNHVNSMSRDIGILEVLGPRPEAARRFMDFKMKAEGVNPVGRAWTNAQYRVLASKFGEGDVDSVWWRAFTGTQGWLRAAMLGSAPISAISDTAFIAATAKINGLDATRTMGKYLATLAPGTREVKEIAKRSGFIAEVVGGAALEDTRFAGEALGKGFTSILANLTHKYSGLQAMTRATQDAVTMEFSATVAEALSAGTKWADLPDDFRAGLERFNFGAEDWADLKGANIYDNGRAKFLITSEMRVDKDLINSLSERFKGEGQKLGVDVGTDEFVSMSAKNRVKDLADKLDDFTMYLRQTAANEPLLATKALTTGAILGDGGAGTTSRVVGATFGLFKSFPITTVLSHGLPAYQRMKVHRKFDHMALTFIGTTVLGALALQMRELAKGKTTRDMDSPKFWMASFLQGGGAGIFGDFLLGDYSRFDRSPISEALGPTVGLFEDIWKATTGNLQQWAYEDDVDGEKVKKDVAGDLFRVMKRNIPLGSLWYGRLALERLVLDNLERMIDPGFDKRMRKYERKIKKEAGQEFWWRPGESRP